MEKLMSPEEFAKLSPDEQKQLMEGMKAIQDQQKKIEEEDKELKQLSMKEFEATVRGIATDLIKGMTDVDKKHFMFPGIGKADADDLSPEGKFKKTRKFFDALVGKDVVALKTMNDEIATKANLSEGTNTAGGFLVPEEFKMEVLRLSEIYGVLRKEARILPMTTDVVNLPAAGTTGQSAIWTSEASQIKQTDPNFRQVVLTVNKLAALPKVTNELLEDSSIDMISYLAELIGEAFAKEEDNQAFNGSGSPFTGMLQATGAPTSPHTGGTGWSALSYQDLVNATGDVYSPVLANAKFYFHRTIIAHIRGLITTSGAPIFGGTANAILGYPLVPAEMAPAAANVTVASTSYAIFGDVRKAVMLGERGSMRVKLTDVGQVDSDNLFEKDMSALRAIERVAMAVALPSAFTKITSAAS